MESLDDPGRVEELQRVILGKPGLWRLYNEVYQSFLDCLRRCPPQGAVIELGSGAGFAKRVIPELITSDILPYRGLDQVFDACNMPFTDNSLRLITMWNTFHHIPDAAAFLSEAQRCLMPGGRVCIVDPHPGWISSPIYRFLHHEPFDPDAPEWQFETTGPLSGANGALAWIVFVRDRAKFARLFPALSLVQYQPTMPLRYWLAGGLKKWSLLPAWGWRVATLMDQCLMRCSRQFGSFVYVELVKDAEQYRRSVLISP